jgi:hypothetical protein
VIEFSEKDGAVTFRVRVQPRASRNDVAGEYNGALKLRITAPPVEGRANEECRRFLARLLDIPPSAIEIIRGGSSRDKTVRVSDISVDRLSKALSV